MPDTVPSWATTIINAHKAVTPTAVSHATRIKSDRYFVWNEDDENDLNADNIHAERGVTGYTDLFTKREFDPWAPASAPPSTPPASPGRRPASPTSRTPAFSTIHGTGR